jgi:hypothetical protein
MWRDVARDVSLRRLDRGVAAIDDSLSDAVETGFELHPDRCHRREIEARSLQVGGVAVVAPRLVRCAVVIPHARLVAVHWLSPSVRNLTIVNRQYVGPTIGKAVRRGARY